MKGGWWLCECGRSGCFHCVPSKGNSDFKSRMLYLWQLSIRQHQPRQRYYFHSECLVTTTWSTRLSREISNNNKWRQRSLSLPVLPEVKSQTLMYLFICESLSLRDLLIAKNIKHDWRLISEGIGLAVSNFLLQKPQSAKLVVIARGKQPLEDLEAQYPNDQVQVLAGDLSDFSLGQKAIDLAISKWGKFGRNGAQPWRHGPCGPDREQ